MPVEEHVLRLIGMLLSVGRPRMVAVCRVKGVKAAPGFVLASERVGKDVALVIVSSHTVAHAKLSSRRQFVLLPLLTVSPLKCLIFETDTVRVDRNGHRAYRCC